MNNLPFRYPGMDNLPEQRVRRTWPFEHADIYNFGPLSIKKEDEAAKGALYDGLIKSVKAFTKYYNEPFRHLEILGTLLVEIESSVNSRPLTYQEERREETPILRPIDFIQREMVITYPFETIGTDEGDETYHAHAQAVLLKIRQQTEDAFKESHQLTERFWKIRSLQYLTALRESHKLQMNNKRSTPRNSEEGQVF
ncbi:hypothetical protein RB195_010479 [Necator americanus]|uniref:Uncharacterized protein n=1 Tax=Necator americanus TaxID=51031 RepID=A0ABR1CZ98_NECAM